jgi:hypothetical protein
MLPFFWFVFDTGTLSNHRVTRRCLVKNAVLTTENWPWQIIYLAYPDTTIYNKITIQFSLVHLGSMVVMFSVMYWLLVWMRFFFENIFYEPILAVHEYYHQTPKKPLNCSFCDLLNFSIANATVLLGHIWYGYIEQS